MQAISSYFSSEKRPPSINEKILQSLEKINNSLESDIETVSKSEKLMKKIDKIAGGVLLGEQLISLSWTNVIGFCVGIILSGGSRLTDFHISDELLRVANEIEKIWNVSGAKTAAVLAEFVSLYHFPEITLVVTSIALGVIACNKGLLSLQEKKEK